MTTFRYLSLTCALTGGLLVANSPSAVAQILWDWVKAPVSRGISYGISSAVDGQGNTIVGGYYRTDSSATALDFGNGVLLPATGGAAFITKYAVDGACRWAVRIAAGTHGQLPAVQQVASDAVGNVLVSGVCADSTWFGSQLLRFPPTIPAGERQGFVGKMSAAGQWQWVRGLFGVGRGGDGVSPTLLAPDVRGNLYVAGTFGVMLQIDALRLPAAPWRSIYGAFIARLDSAGRCQWIRGPRGQCDIGMLTDLKVDAAGDAYLVGVIDALAIFGTDTLRGRTVSWGGGPGPAVPATGPADVFVAHLNAAGQWRGAYDLGTGTSARLTFGANGQRYVAGYFLEPQEHFYPSATGTDTLLGGGVYVAHLGAQGQRLALRHTDKGNYVDVAPDGTAYLAGLSQDSLTFGAYTLPARPNRTFYVAGLSATNEWFGVTEVTNPNALPSGFPQPTFLTDLHVQDAALYLYGQHQGEATFGPVVLTSPGAPATPLEEFFVARLGMAVVGVPKPTAEAALALWPNPAPGEVQVTTATGGAVQVLDALGRVVYSTYLAPGTSRLRLPFAPGLYTLRCGAAARKLLVQLAAE